MVELDNLRRITYELATEVESGTEGPTFDIVTFILDQVDSPAMIVDGDLEVVYQNLAMSSWLSHDYQESKCFTAVDRESPCNNCDVLDALGSREVVYGDNSIRENNASKVTIPLIFNGVSGAIVLFEVSDDE